MHSKRSHPQSSSQQAVLIAIVADQPFVDGSHLCAESSAVLNPHEIRRLARLARLKVTEDELPGLALELSKIVSLVDQLAEVPTDGIEPMVHAFDLQNVLAPDQAQRSLPREEALRNAPSHDGECFLVPAVLG